MPSDRKFPELSKPPTGWIVCQIGAREYFNVARGLNEIEKLERLYTDIWIPPYFHRSSLIKKFKGRFPSDLDKSKIVSFNCEAVARRLRPVIQGQGEWDQIFEYNKWFQRKVSRSLRELQIRSPGPRSVFAYSYAALEILRTCKSLGWTSFLGQIDPGLGESRIISRLAQLYGLPEEHIAPNFTSYWESWIEETKLADFIVANSSWSKSLLVAEGVESDKIIILPLSYSASHPPSTATKQSKKLRVLFLGQAIPRKGIVELIEASQRLSGKRVEISVVGPAPPKIAQKLHSLDTLTWHGRSPRSEISKYYDWADILVLPTHSDGFAITQYEAMSRGVPVMASQYCGDVVVDGWNGIKLTKICPQEIAKLLDELSLDRERLDRLRHGALNTKIPTPKEVAKSLYEFVVGTE